ncbi:MAG: glycosyltransferase [Nitrospirota bacterium]
MPKVSVIIPCYNLGIYLDEAVDSVLAQTYQDYEIIIINDGSTDEFTNNLLKDYSKPKCTIYTTPNQGLPAARNYGIERSKGECICCLDADDKYHPEFLVKTMASLDGDKEHKYGFVTSYVQVFGEENYIWETAEYNPYRLAVDNRIHVASLFRKQCWEEVGGYSTNLSGYQDWDFWISIAAKGYEWKIIKEPLFYYRIRKNSMLKTSDKKRNALYNQIIENNKNFYKNNFLNILLEFQKIRDIDIHAYQDLKRELETTTQRLQNTEQRLQDTAFYLQQIFHSRTYRLMKIFKDALHSKKKLFLLPLRIPWLFLSVDTQNKIKVIYHKIKNTYNKLILKVISIKNVAWPQNYPIVSVVIPCFNYGQYIEEAIDSVLNQTFHNFEIIVVDGGSTDKATIQKLKSLNKPKTTIYYREGRHLVGDNRNYGIEKAQGKYICCLDADDMIKPSYLEKGLFLAETYNYDIVYPSVQCFEGDNFLWAVNVVNLLSCADGDNLSTVSIFKKEAWKKVRGFRDWGVGVHHVPEDWEFWVRLLGHGYRAKRLPEPLMLYRVHHNSLTATNKKSSDDQKKLIREANKKLFEKQNLRRIKKLNNISYSVQNQFVNLIQDHTNHKKILFALPFMITGGADTILLKIAKYLSLNNFHISCITTIPVDENWGDNTSRYEAITKEVYHLYKFLESQEYWKDFIYYLIETRRIDILFIVGCEFVYHMLPGIKVRCPSLIVVDQLFNEFGHIQNNRKYAEFIDCNIVANTTIENMLSHQYHEQKDRVKVIIHGVDVQEEFNPVSLKKLNLPPVDVLPDNKFIVGYFGRFSKEKRPDVFVDIIDAFKDKDDIHFVMTGDGPEYSNVKEKIERIGLKHKVYAPGFVDDIRPFLCRTHVLVIPSKIEGIPIILLEGLSMGIPVVASNVGGMPSIITDYKNGFLCEYKNTDAFIEKINLLYKDQSLRSEMSKNARLYAEQKLDITKMLEQYKETFLNLITYKNRE